MGEEEDPLAGVVGGKVISPWVVTAVKTGAGSPMRGMPVTVGVLAVGEGISLTVMTIHIAFVDGASWSLSRWHSWLHNLVGVP